VQLTLKQGDVALQTMNNQMLPMLMNLLEDVDGVTLRLNDFTEQLNDNPSMLIRGKTPTPLGPGEKAVLTKARG
jgi:phospholipid/cholesterol/gamma-HCH transport system substrate-binding protein